MKNIEVRKLDGLNEGYKKATIDIFVDSFGYMFTFTKKREELEELFMSSLDFSMVYVAIYENKVLGLMVIGNNKTRPMHFDLSKCKEIFGDGRGTIIKKQLTLVMEKIAVKEEKDLYIDYLATAKNYRGQGVGTKLLDFAFNKLGYEEFYIEVLSKNKGAKNLYEKLGFKEYKRSYNPIIMIQGLGYLIKLKKQFNQ